MLKTDTFSRLPAVTRVIPAIQLKDLPRQALPHNHSAPTHTGVAASAAHVDDEASRWSSWGAARDGAITTLSKPQIAGAIIASVFVGAFLLLAHSAFLMAAIAVITIVYLMAGLYKATLLLRGELADGGITVDAYAIPDAQLPVYSILVPLFNEREFVPTLIKQLLNIDYPADRLEVILLIESDDTDTRSALERLALPPHMYVLNVPDGRPRTKPRALNVGLAHASGEFIVVYDVEDRPEPDQLRKAVAAFRALPRRVICLQARLNYYNRYQSLLTRLFSIDYAIWYDMLLPGLMRKNAVVPLGGTSNHFRISTLRRLGGWDPYNVTEDADLGVRISRVNLQVMMLDSITWEEAVAHAPQWVRQRSRWVKGYIQTYLVHMRHPVALLRDLGPAGFTDFQLLIGGTSLMLLVNPIMWALTLTYFISKGTPVASTIHSLFPPTIYYAALLCLLANYAFFYSQLYIVVRRGYHDLARYALLGPLYWVLMSMGAWAGLVSLIRSPHYWAKTHHGDSLASNELATVEAVADSLIMSVDLADSPTQPSLRSLRGLRTSSNGHSLAASATRLTAHSLSVILPAYNEEASIATTVISVVRTISKWDLDFEVVVVNDGSHDQTGAILDELAAGNRRIRAVTHDVNRGYGAALVTGFESARNELTFFMDSDGQFDINELATFLPLIDHYDAVLGYRINRKDPPMRLLNAWGWKQLVRLLLGVKVRDIDCAFKLFRTDFFRTHYLDSRGAMINAEILYRLRRGGYTMTQVGVHHLERKAGKATGAKLSVILRALKELLVYSYRWRMTE